MQVYCIKGGYEQGHSRQVGSKDTDSDESGGLRAVKPWEELLVYKDNRYET